MTNFIAIPTEYAVKYFKAKQERDATFKKKLVSLDEIQKANETLALAAIELAEQALK